LIAKGLVRNSIAPAFLARTDIGPIYLGVSFDVADAVSDGSAAVELKR